MQRQLQTSDPPEPLLSALTLALVPGVGPRTRQRLLERFGSAEAVLSAPLSQLRQIPRIGSKLCQAIATVREQIDAAAEIECCRQADFDIVLHGEEGYPKPLDNLPDRPGVLFVRGKFEPRDAMAIAIVGSRHATHYGLAQAERLAGSLARSGMTIVSGLARGIDAAAHRGAISAGGRTIGVLASGVLNVYPPEHKQLAEEVAKCGAVVSESPPHVGPLSGMFPQRNRIISGLSLGVLVVEASTRSGALITARHAMEQGRDVFAVPGPVDSRMSRGCHQLIRDGAKLVETADDVLEELGPLAAAMPTGDGQQEIHHPAELVLNDLELQVLAAVPSAAATVDTVIAASNLSPPQVLATLSVLEMRRLIRRLSGNLVMRL